MRAWGASLLGWIVVGLAFAPGPALADSVNLYVAPTGTSAPPACGAPDPCALGALLGYLNSNAYGANVQISLAAGTYPQQTYTLTGSAPSYTLAGAGAGTTTLSGGNTDQVLNLETSAPATVENLTLKDGSSAGPGADVWDHGSGTVTLDDDVVDGGTTDYDLADVTAGLMTIENSTIESANANNDVGGAGVSGAGVTLQIDDSTLTDDLNDAVSVVGNGTADIDDSTLVGTTSDLGAAYDNVGTLNVLDSTFSDDRRALDSEGSNAIVNFAGNILDAGLGTCVYNPGSVYNSDGYNVENDNSCDPGTGGKENVSIAALGLGPLANNGGPTETEKITPASAAHDVVPVTTGLVNFCFGDDQRGMPRTQPGATTCDAGAYQYAPPAPTGTTPSGGESGSSVTLTGTNFADVTGLTVGSKPAGFVVQSATSITVTVPELPEGSAEIAITNPDGTGDAAFTVTGPAITVTSLPAGRVGSPYNRVLTASGGTLPLTWSLTSGALPRGLSLSSAGEITGTPTAAGTSTFTALVADSDGESDPRQLSLTIAPTTPLEPSIKIASTKLGVHKSRIAIVLSCSGARCVGTVVLIGPHSKRLATGTYKLAPGTHKTLELRLTKTGRTALEHASRRTPVRAELVVTVTGGRTSRGRTEIT